MEIIFTCLDSESEVRRRTDHAPDSPSAEQMLVEKDKTHLQMTDDQFNVSLSYTIDNSHSPGKMSVKSSVFIPKQKPTTESGRVDKFLRWPSDLKKYLTFKEKVLQTFKSVEKYVLVEKLNWSDPPETHSSIPYCDERTPS